MTTLELQRQFTDAQARAKTLLDRTMGQARAEERAMTESERTTIQSALNEAKSLKQRLDNQQGDANMLAELDRLTSGMTSSKPTRQGAGASGGLTLGQQFINSDTFRWLQQHKGSLPTGGWTSPASELSPITMMATLLDESSGSGGKLIVSDYQPGVLPILTRRLVVADLIAPGTTESNSITYMKETTFTNAAAAVAEGGTKPESTLVFDQVTDPVQKIAHWIPATEELLEDVSQAQSYIDSRMRLGVQLAEDDAVLNGNGTPPQIMGLMNRSGLATAVARGADTNADAIAKQISAIATNSFLFPEGVVLNPANWLTIQLAKDANGNYYGDGGPFARMQTPTLWGLPVALTPAIVANTALVGAFRSAAQIFRKGGLRVEASNSHSTFFIENKIAIRAEERLALAVYRASAVGKVTGLN